ncbi:MAG TPA: ASCH domain-containing protein [Candidatus Dormibacteraeota bacterium]
MRALSIRHPFIDVILAGTKPVEVRAYATLHRGDLLLHASGSYSYLEKEELARLRAAGHEVPDPTKATRGALVGVAQLTDCHRMTEADWSRALIAPREGTWWAWELEAVEAFPEPIPYPGRLFMFEVEDEELEDALAAAST